MDERRITDNIKRLRLKQEMSLEQLARRTGLTRGYLSKIENSDKAPPFSTLLKIAEGLGVDIAFLIFEDGTTGASQETRFSIVRANEREGTNRGHSAGYQYESLAYRRLGKTMEPFIVRPSFDEKEPFSHRGEEFIYTLEGSCEFVYGNERYVLNKGDSIYFDSSVPHAGRSIGKKRARVLSVIYSSKRHLP